MYKVGIITASDKGSKGEREDLSGLVIKEMVTDAGYEVVSLKIVPDEREALSNEMIRLADVERVHLILTTGGTGFSKRDVTPEATKAVISKREVPIVSTARLVFHW